jgi:D-alanyl-lipoteichoic acid acyltransferase DltB (MBOAT superfamily)
MPVGVSFFTFKLISYVVEVCRERIEPSRDFASFANYVSFFPTILSGPIDRPQNFLVQMSQRRLIDGYEAIDGFRQILWGMSKKMLIADNIANFVDVVWSEPSVCGSAALVRAALIYPIQMYMDFSGYSDMAIGVGKILNIKVAKNFKYPFFVTNVAEYWRRWHMSLTGWLTDYVFMPINVAFRDKGTWGTIIAVLFNFLLIGMWHGASWTFAIFGLYYGLLYIPLILNGSFQKKQKVKFVWYKPNIGFLIKMVCTYLLVSAGLIIFKAPNIETVIHFVSEIFKFSSSSIPINSRPQIKTVIWGFIILYMFLEWIAFVKEKREYAVQLKTSRWISLAIDLALVLTLSWFADSHSVQFIYFNF